MSIKKVIRKWLCKHGWFCKEGSEVLRTGWHTEYGRVVNRRCSGCGREWWHLQV